MFPADRQTPPPNRQPGVNPPISDGQPSAASARRAPNLQHYQQKKTLAQGMMDLALLSANANQLRIVIEHGSSYAYFYVTAFLISFSIVLQVIVGILLVWNSQYDVKKDHQMPQANKINNITVIGIFGVTVINILIAAFGPLGTATTVNGYSV